MSANSIAVQRDAACRERKPAVRLLIRRPETSVFGMLLLSCVTARCRLFGTVGGLSCRMEHISFNCEAVRNCKLRRLSDSRCSVIVPAIRAVFGNGQGWVQGKIHKWYQ